MHDATAPTGEKPGFEPWNVELEQALLGLALINPKTIAFMQAELTAADFFDPLHQRLMERVFAKYEADLPVSPLTLHASLKNDAGLAAVGGSDYLAGCAQAAPAAGSADELYRQVRNIARSVADLRVRRDAERAIADSAELLRLGKPIDEAMVPVVELADFENERMEYRHGAVTIAEAGDALMREIERSNDDEALPAAPTGIGLLNDIIGGYFCANLIVVGGRPGMGKSIVGELAARVAAASGFSVDYFDLENKTGVLTARMLCDLDYDRAFREGRPPIHYSRVHLRRLSDDEKGWIAEANLQLRELDIDVHDRDELTIAQVASICRAKAARTKKPKLFIIDHMHLIEPSSRYAGRKVDEISEVTKGAKRLAKRLDSSVLLLAQLNRDLERRDDKRPTMADFRESGSIEQDADVMIGLNRPHYHLERSRPKSDATEAEKGKHQQDLVSKANVLELGILKNRHGRTGEIAVYVDVASSAIRDEAPSAQTQIDFANLPRPPAGQSMF